MIPVRIDARPDDDGFKGKPEPAILPMPGVPRRPDRGAATTAPGRGDEFGPRDIVNALRYHNVVFITLGSLVAGALGTAAWLLVPAKYTTYSMVYVAPRDNVIVEARAGADRAGDLDTVVKTQASIIKSAAIITGALRDPKIAQLAMVREQPNPAEFFEEEIKPETSANSSIIKVTMSGKNPAEITQFVNAVVNFYFEKVKADNQYKQRHIEQLTKSKRELEEMRDKAQKFLESQMGAGAVEGMSVKQKARLFEYQKTQHDLEEARLRLTMEREALKAAEAKLAEADSAPVTVPFLEERTNADRAIVAKRKALQALEATIADHLNRRKNPYDATYHEMVQQLENGKVRYAALRDEFRQKEERINRESMKEERKRNLEASRVAVAGLEIVERAKGARLQHPDFKDIDQETGAKPMTGEQRKALDEFNRYNAQAGAIDQAMIIQKINLDAEPRIRMYDPAQVPTKPEMKKQIAVTGVAGLFGFGLVGAVISVAEIRRKRVYSPQDPIFQPTRLPLLGVIPEHGFAPAGADLARPQAGDVAGRAFIEAVDKLRTAVGRAMVRRKMQVLLVTSAAPDEGKSILAWNLALSSARADRRTLFIDANMKNPGLHNHFDIASHPGLSELLRGERPVQQVVQRSALANLWCIAAGVCDDASRQALDKDGLRRLLDKARQDFDCVVLDSCSVQEAVDPLYIAQRADGVLLSLRTFHSRVGAVEKAVERLTMAGGQLLGAVLTDATGAAYEM